MNSTTPEILYEELVEISLATLDRTIPANIGLFLTGSLAFTTNILVILIILKLQSANKTSNTAHFLILQLAIADWLVGASYVAAGVKRLVRIQLRIPEVNTQVACCAEMSVSYFSQAASLTLALAISVERTIATFSPVRYRANRRSLVTCLTLIGWIYAAVDTGFMFHGISNSKLIPNCNLVSSVSSGFYSFQSAHKLAKICVMMLLYIVILIFVIHRVQEAKKQNENVHMIKKQMQVRVARMLGVIALMYLVTQIITRIGLAILGKLPAAVRANYGPFIRMLMIVNSGINFFVYISLNIEYKNGFRLLFGTSLADISPTNTRTMANGRNMIRRTSGLQDTNIRRNKSMVILRTGSVTHIKMEVDTEVRKKKSMV